MGTLALHLSWLAVPDSVLSDRWQSMSRGFSESCVPFQGVIEPGERGRGPPCGSAGDLGAPFCGWRLIWDSLVGLGPVGPHASSSEREWCTAALLENWLLAWDRPHVSGSDNQPRAVPGPSASGQRVSLGGTEPEYATEPGSTERCQRRGQSRLAGCHLESPGRKQGRRASEGLSGLCFKDNTSGRGGVSAAGKWRAASGGGGGCPCSLTCRP